VTHGRLSLRALNRAALDRQLLLDPSPMTALDAVRHLTIFNSGSYWLWSADAW
jgi:hypothetical protein